MMVPAAVAADDQGCCRARLHLHGPLIRSTRASDQHVVAPGLKARE